MNISNMYDAKEDAGRGVTCSKTLNYMLILFHKPLFNRTEQGFNRYPTFLIIGIRSSPGKISALFFYQMVTAEQVRT